MATIMVLGHTLKAGDRVRLFQNNEQYWVSGVVSCVHPRSDRFFLTEVRDARGQELHGSYCEQCRMDGYRSRHNDWVVRAIRVTSLTVWDDLTMVSMTMAETRAMMVANPANCYCDGCIAARGESRYPEHAQEHVDEGLRAERAFFHAVAMRLQPIFGECDFSVEWMKAQLAGLNRQASRALTVDDLAAELHKVQTGHYHESLPMPRYRCAEAGCGRRATRRRKNASGKWICKTCDETLYERCSPCGNRRSRAVMVVAPSGMRMCQSCYEARFTRCEECNGVTTRQWNAGGRYYCLTCFENRYFRCSCGRVIERGAEVMSASAQRMVCQQCQRSNDMFFSARVSSVAGVKYERVATRRRYGVELESDGKQFATRAQTVFGAVHDGSIAGPEYVSPILSGDEGLEAIEELCRLGIECDARCGFHLHMDATDLTVPEVVRVARGYLAIQDLCFHMVAPSRQDNHYCHKIRTPYTLDLDNKVKLKEALYGYGYDSSGRKYHDKRYEWLNVHSYLFRGTLEVRLHQGTFNAERIRNWINLNLLAVEYFREMDDAGLAGAFLRYAFEKRPELKAYMLDRVKRFKGERWQFYHDGIERIGGAVDYAARVMSRSEEQRVAV